MKTLEFKLRLNRAERETVNQWLSTLRWVWNEGLGLLIECDRYSAFNKTDAPEGETKEQKAIRLRRAPMCPIGWEYRYLKQGDEWIPVPYSERAYVKPYRPFCPLRSHHEHGAESDQPWDYHEPKLNHPSLYDLQGYFTHKNHPNNDRLKDVPANFIRGTLHSLSTAWDRYKGRKGGQPKFKRKGQTGGSLIHEDGKAIVVKGDTVRVPKLGIFRVRGLIKRWGNTQIKVLKVMKRPSGYYLQLTGELPEKPMKPRSFGASQRESHPLKLTIQQRDGVLAVREFDGREYRPAPEDVKLLNRLKELQQQLSRQNYLSKNWYKTKEKIGKIHETLRLRGRNYNQKLSTYIVRTHGDIEIEAGKIGMIDAPETILSRVDPPHYEPNGAERVADINKQRSAKRSGQFVELISQKAKKNGREVSRVKPEKKPAKMTRKKKAKA